MGRLRRRPGRIATGEAEHLVEERRVIGDGDDRPEDAGAGGRLLGRGELGEEAVDGLTSGHMSRLATIRYFLDLGIAAHDEKANGKTPGLTPTEWDAEIFAAYVRRNQFTRYMNTDDGLVKPEQQGAPDV